MPESIITNTIIISATRHICHTCDCGCRHTSQFLMIWLTFVPLGLWTVCEWFTPVVCCVVSFLLLGIENIGIQIEQPFKVCKACQQVADSLAHGLLLACTKPRLHSILLAPSLAQVTPPLARLLTRSFLFPHSLTPLHSSQNKLAKVCYAISTASCCLPLAQMLPPCPPLLLS